MKMELGTHITAVQCVCASVCVWLLLEDPDDLFGLLCVEHKVIFVTPHEQIPDHPYKLTHHHI